MTTIAFKDGVLAADVLSTSGSYRAGMVRKIERVGRLRIGGAGSWVIYEKFRNWIREGLQGDSPLKENNGNVFVVLPDNRAVCWCDDGPFMLEDTWALGSGEQLAMGAMLAGASAEEAVRIAMQVDTLTGGDVVLLQ